MIDVFGEVVDLVWRQAPDAAIEAGRLPSRLWEDLVAGGGRAVEEESAALRAAVRGQHSGEDDAAVDAALHHLRCVASSAGMPVATMLNHMTGPVARLAWAATAWPSAFDPEGEVYLERLRLFPHFCREVVEASGSGAEASRPVLAAFIRQAETALVENRGPVPPLLAPVPAGSPAAYEALGAALHGMDLLRRHATTLQSTAAPASPLAVSQSGPAKYQAAIERGTSTGLTAVQIEDIGRRLLAATEARFGALAEDPRVRIGRPLEPTRALDCFSEVHLVLDEALGRVTERRPRMPCDVRPLPDAHGEVGPPAYYGPSSERNERHGTLFVNTSAQANTRAWEVLPLAMHEGVPGHHLQIALLDESLGLADVLRLLPVNAFTEGWAVYAETLAEAMGVDVGPEEEFGLLAHQRWRAGRLLVDIGLHVHGWSVTTATEVLARLTRQNPRAVEREVVRYLAWPGQALGYAVGADVIRGWVEQQVSAGVGLAAAHTRLLELGSIPLTVLDTGSRYGT